MNAQTIMEYKNLNDSEKLAQSLNIHQGVFPTGLKGKLLSDLNEDGLTIGESAYLSANEVFDPEGEEPFSFVLAGIESELLDCPIGGYTEISDVFMDTPSRQQEMIDFLNEPGTLAADAPFGDWAAPPCDSAARELFWNLKTSEMKAEKAWVIAYFQDKIDTDAKKEVLDIGLKIVDGKMVVSVNEIADVLTAHDSDILNVKVHLEEFDGDMERAVGVLHKWSIQDYLFRKRCKNVEDECIYDYTSNEEAFAIQNGTNPKYKLKNEYWMELEAFEKILDKC